MRRPPALLFGIAIENVTMDEAVELIGELVARGRAQRKSHQIATVNVDFLANAVDDTSLAEILRTADACLADGMPVVWACSWLGMPLVERVAGADLVPLLFDLSQTTGWRIHVLGSSPSVAERARQLIAERFPAANVTIDPEAIIGADADVEPELLDEIEAIDADILCVALGNPKQERFIVRHGGRLRTPVMIGVGGSLDMMVGERKRAPEWVQRVGMEWVVRALQEPKRLGVRYARDITTIGPWLATQWRQSFERRDHPGVELSADDAGVRITLGTVGTPSGEDWFRSADLVRDGAGLTIDPSGAVEINDRGAAMLVGLARTAQRSGSSISWARDPRTVAAALSRLQIPPSSLNCNLEWRPNHSE